MPQTVDTITGEKVDLDDMNTGLFSLCDSLAFFYSHRQKNYQYSCYNLKTGKHISFFFPIGRGAGEFLNVTPIQQIYVENKEQKALFMAINEEKAGIFNITQSIKQNQTICDTLFDFKWSQKNNRPFISAFLYDKNHILAHQQQNRLALNEEKYAVPRFLMIDFHTGKITKTYDLYIEPGIYNPTAGKLNGQFYTSINLLSPDRTKVVMLMNMLPQMNILHLATGELQGIKIEGLPDFKSLKRNSDKLKEYYTFSAVDNNYIYALFADRSLTEPETHQKTSRIFIFDWEGNLRRELRTNNPIDQIQIDSANRCLYGVDFAEEEVFRYPLKF